MNRGIVGLVLAGLLAAALPAARAAGDPWLALGVTKATPSAEAPGFTLPDLDGRPVSLEAFRGRVVLLYFWATW